MTLFELVKLALDQLYAEGVEHHGTDLDEIIKKKMAYLSKNYVNLDNPDRNPINYKDPATRFAYVYMYVATHGDYIVQHLEDFATLSEGSIFSGEVARVSCVGGGPGSDVIGLIKYLAENGNEPVKKLTCYLLDGEQAWADTWTEIDDGINSDLNIHVNFQPLNVTDPESWSSQKKFLKADLFTFSYFVSEVMAFDQDGVVTKFWDKIFAEAESGTKFLYIDNGSQKFNDFFDGFWKKRNDIVCLSKKNNFTRTPRYSERSDAIADYKLKFDKSPKLKAIISCRLLVKK